MDIKARSAEWKPAHFLSSSTSTHIGAIGFVGLALTAYAGAHLQQLTLPLLVCTSTYLLSNRTFVAIVVSLEAGTPAMDIVRRHLAYLSLSYAASVAIALLMISSTQPSTNLALGAILLLLVVGYPMTRISMTQVEDSSRHLAQLNKVYGSALETLASVIDAKDHGTHGHIRRVQSLAVELAKAVGMRDCSELRGLEAAALLHDLGKLAVPEHIVNKPGPLTAREYEAMKAHAAIGADIVERIEFPYPVAPIVRHHHERWDGNGYPDGLSGEGIPLGARILAVADCYDALTSDRPYRRRLAEQDALEVIRAASGSKYNPAVVTAFCAARVDRRQAQGLYPGRMLSAETAA